MACERLMSTTRLQLLSKSLRSRSELLLSQVSASAAHSWRGGLAKCRERHSHHSTSRLEDRAQPQTRLTKLMCVAGAHRTGKSYLLSRLASQSGVQPFAVGDTVQAKTKGIWMLTSLVAADDSSPPVLFMDTEGLFASEASAEQDAQIFALAVLLSGTLLYNSTGAISQDAISTLALACKLAHKVSLDSSASAAREASARLQWVLRDFSLELVDEDGDDITPGQYMQAALQATKATSRDAARINASRTVIASVFPDRFCTVLPPPCDSPADLATGNATPRVQFESQLRELRASILGDGASKAGCMNGPTLLQLARCYVASLNEGSVPNLGTAWGSATAAASAAAVQKAQSLVEQDLTTMLSIETPLHTLKAHAGAVARGHSELAHSTSGFHWDGPGERNYSSTQPAWLVLRPMTAPTATGGAVLTSVPEAEQLLWALHDGELTVPPSHEEAQAGMHDAYKLHSATWEETLCSFGLPARSEGIFTARGPASAAAILQAISFITLANKLHAAHCAHNHTLIETIRSQESTPPVDLTGVWGASNALRDVAWVSDGKVLLQHTAAGAQAYLANIQGQHAMQLQEAKSDWATRVAAASRDAHAAQRQLRDLEGEHGGVLQDTGGAQSHLADLQAQIMETQQRVSALRAQRRAAAAAADEAQSSHQAAVQELKLQIQQTQLRVQRHKQRTAEEGERAKQERDQAAAASAAAERAAAAAARATAAAEAAEALERAAAAEDEKDKAAAAAMRRGPAPAEISESSGKSAGCCVVQ